MTRKRIIIIGSIVAICVILVIVFSMNGNEEEAIPVRTAEVSRQKIVETVTATGQIQPQTQVKISADVAAKIKRLDVKEGDWVEKGHFLVQWTVNVLWPRSKVPKQISGLPKPMQILYAKI